MDDKTQTSANLDHEINSLKRRVDELERSAESEKERKRKKNNPHLYPPYLGKYEMADEGVHPRVRCLSCDFKCNTGNHFVRHYYKTHQYTIPSYKSEYHLYGNKYERVGKYGHRCLTCNQVVNNRDRFIHHYKSAHETPPPRL